MTKIAALYDIHGNLPALEAVLAELEYEAVDAIVIGGDTIAGPLPTETLARLAALSVPLHYIHGNGESEMLRVVAGEPPNGLTPVADKDAHWVAEQLSEAEIGFVQSWPLSVELVVDGLGSVLFCHATPQDDITIFTEETDDARVLSLMGDASPDTIICGHTHMQFLRKIGRKQIHNAGSVGAPFGGTGAYWLLIDGDQISHRHTTYDLAAAANRLRQSTAPDAASFADNRVLTSPSVETIMPLLRKFAAAQLDA